jgi:hypothetical protein
MEGMPRLGRDWLPAYWTSQTCFDWMLKFKMYKLEKRLKGDNIRIENPGHILTHPWSK